MSAMEWQVSFTLQAAAITAAEVMLVENFYDARAIDASGSMLPGTGQVQLGFGIRADRYDSALVTGHHFLLLYPDTDLSGLVVAAAVMTIAELERRAANPTMPVLIGTAEVAEILRVSRQRVHQLRLLPAFPPPLIQVAAGPLWDERAIRKFERTWTRTPGRPVTPKTARVNAAAQRV